MNNTIDWFALDMEAFQKAYDDYLAAEQEHEEAVAQREACEEGTCSHERRLKKDGTPHKGIPCPQGYASYANECDTGNYLYYRHHKAFFEAIGLGVKANA